MRHLKVVKGGLVALCAFVMLLAPSLGAAAEQQHEGHMPSEKSMEHASSPDGAVTSSHQLNGHGDKAEGASDAMQPAMTDLKAMDHGTMKMSGQAKEAMDHQNHAEHSKMVPDGTTPDLSGHVHKEPQNKEAMAGVDEKLGDIIPEGLTFRDAHGNKVDPRSLMTAPVVIVPVYYTCPSVCHLLQSAVARVLPQVDLQPGKDYIVISVSFDELDTPEIAAQRKRNYMAAMKNAFPETAWHFLSGDKQNVDAFMNSIGYKFTRIDKDLVHPVAIVVASGEGKVVRYLYGNSFLPFDVTMALTEASQGKVGLSLKRAVAYCFAYDPQGKRYVFSFMRIAGIIVLFGVGVLFFVLTRGGRKSKDSN